MYLADINGTTCIAKRLHDILIGAGKEEKVGKKQYEASVQKFRQECLFLSQMRHPNIVQFMGVHCDDQDPSDITLFMERLPTDLHLCLTTCHDIQYKLPHPIEVSILVDICSGLLHLHHSGIVHRDLSASNVLLTPDMHAKIADLGVSKILDHIAPRSQKLTTAPGALAYMPPEALALNDSPNYDTKLDVFSFGVITLFVAIHEFPQFSWERAPDDVFKRGEEAIWARRKWIRKMGDKHPLASLVHQCLLVREKRLSTEELWRILQQLQVKYSSSLEDILDSFMHLSSLLKLE